MDIELSGTISNIMPYEIDVRGQNVQRILLNNVNTSHPNPNVQINPTVLVIVRTIPTVTIPFAIGEPITCKGKYEAASPYSRLPTLTYVHAPNGFVRYHGTIYR
jgi:hypothetical protein